MMAILETERLILRRQRLEDIDSLVDLWSDAEVTRYLGGPREQDWLRTEFEAVGRNPEAEPFDLWSVIENGTGVLVGHSGLLEKVVAGNPEIELIYIIAASAWGKGYATEIGKAIIQYAFDKMEIERLIALIEPENSPSERVAHKVGMRFDREVERPGGAVRRMYIIESRE